MSAKDRIFFPRGVNQYVPGMQYASNLIGDQPAAFSLGTPAAVSATAVTSLVPANAVANTVLALAAAITLDSPYGRSLRLTPSGDPGNSASILVRGVDYLGQPMAELFTGASGSTAILYGRKAFARVDDTKVITPASNAVTWSVGTGFRLGLPYKGDVVWAKENGVLVNVFKRDTLISRTFDAADAVAGKSKFIRAPFPGFVNQLIGTPDAGGSTNDPVVTVKLATVAIIGLTVTVDTSDTTGLTVTDLPTTPGYNANNRFVTNGLIEIVGAAAASSFGYNVSLLLTPTQFSLPDLTDPQTTALADPRGTYEALQTYDGSQIIVGLSGDNAVNAAGNGGLQGIRHVTG